MFTKDKYTINRREYKNLNSLNVEQSELEKEQKFTSENITTYKICTATPDKQQLLYKGEIQNFYTNLKRKRIGLTNVTTRN